MALTRLNNRSISAVTELPSSATSSVLSALSSTNLPSGTALQVVKAEYNGTTTFAASGYVGILSATITPKKANSKFLIMIDMKASHTNSESLYFSCVIDGNRDIFSRGAGYPSATGSIYMEGYGNSHSSNAQIDTFNGSMVYERTSSSAFTVLVEGVLQGGTAYMNYAYSYDDLARGRPKSTLTIIEFA